MRSLRKERSDFLRIFDYDQQLIAESYGEVFICCGQPTCRCHEGGGHYTTRLQQWVDGKLKTKIVRVADRESVKKASDYDESHKFALRDMKNLHAKERKILKRIVTLKTTTYQ